MPLGKIYLKILLLSHSFVIYPISENEILK